MAKNLMPELRKLLELKIGERFRIKIGGHVNGLTEFWFTEDDLIYKMPPNKDGIAEVREASHETIVNLLYGTYEVVKIPWVPKLGEYYWYVLHASGIGYPQTARGLMKENIFGLINLIHGNYFRTQEEAEKNKYNVVEAMKKMYAAL